MENPNGEPKNTADKPLNLTPIVVVITIVTLMIIFGLSNSGYTEIEYDAFVRQVNRGNVIHVTIGKTTLTGRLSKFPEDEVLRRDSKGEKVPLKTENLGVDLHFSVTIPSNADVLVELTKTLAAQGVGTRFVNQTDGSGSINLLITLLVTFALIYFVWSMTRSQRQFMGGGFLSGFMGNLAKRYEGASQPVTFKDVAGLASAKADLQEVVDFLKSPKKFQRLGGHVPKGILLSGAPGTGKTLMARAVAGEAGTPFFSVNGSEFIQMFVGVGASRVRDLFRSAKSTGPAIIFVDEIDAVGRQRGAGMGGGNDEREQTLNQILSEMDGFTPNDYVIVLAATNRPDVLDPALLRPGRFDRIIMIDRPTRAGRLELFQVHARKVPLGEDVRLEDLADATIGLTGADIRNIVNEAALWAARHDKLTVDMEDFTFARDKVLLGARRELVLSPSDKERTAYHEAGHTILSWFLPGANRVHKVTVIPRGRALGMMQMIPSEDRVNRTEGELRDDIAVSMGGKAAEKVVYGDASQGAENDLEIATNLVRRMVTNWGMSDRLGPVSYKFHDEDPFLGREITKPREFSEHTMQLIDHEVTRVLGEALERAISFLREHRDLLDRLAEALIRSEELDERELTVILGPSTHSEASSQTTSLAERTSGEGRSH